MERMSDFDPLGLSGRNLQAFLAVIEEGSVTAAAKRLGLTQSAVSHTIERLRALVGDPLFVRCGRNVVPTAHALAMAAQAEDVVERMKAFAGIGGFDPAGAALSLVVAANDLQRDVLLPDLMRRLAAEGTDTVLRVVSSGRPAAAMLREDRCTILVTPRPPQGADIVQKALFRDRYVCFFDQAARPPPATLAEYLAADHATVVYDDNDVTAFDAAMAARGIKRRFRVSVPGFAGIPAFLRGTAMLASLPSLLGRSIMQDFAWVPLPLPAAELPMYMVWHVRHQHDPRHLWLRRQLQAAADEVAQPAARTGGA